MKTFVLLPLFLFTAVLAAPQVDDISARREFRKFQRDFKKVYESTQEEEQRFQVFKQNLIDYKEHNDKKLGWTEGVTKFSDLTRSEFRSLHLNGYVNMYKDYFGERPPGKGSKIMQSPPTSVDWRDNGAISNVKDQGSCGSCWAFTTVEVIESYAYLSNKTMKELSPQHINSCTPNPLVCGGTGGCAGSIVELGLGYTQLYGVQSETDYPYLSGSTGATEDCYHDPASGGSVSSAYVRGYEVLPRNDYNAVINHLVNVGPLAVGVDASFWSFYSGGVFDNCPVDQNIQINHAVQLVGYGVDEEEGEYWLVRNSWGVAWGEEGYIRLKRNVTPLCGTDNTPLVGTGCVNDGVPEQYVCGTCGILFDVMYPIGAFYV